jgi:cysteine desulfurase
MRRIHLDHQASTPVLPEVFEAMRPFFTEQAASPSALHQGGLLVRDALDKAREQVAALIHAASPEEIIFTSGGTESANLAVKGVALASQRQGRHLVLSTIEHPAVMQSAEALEQQGFHVTRVPADREGFVNPDDVRAALTDETVLVAVHLANHDLGTIQPVAEIGALCGEAAVPLFVDASYSGGWLPVDVQAAGISLLSLAPHRFYGPKGVGVLYRNRRTRLQNLFHGGVQEGGRRPGTENVPAIVGAGAAAEHAARDLAQRAAHVSAMQQRLWEGLSRSIAHLRLHGPAPGPRRIPTNLHVSAEGVEGEGVLLRCDLKGVAFSSGTACVSRAMKASPVLQAIGVDAALALGSILLSPGKDTTAEEIDAAVEVIAEAVEALREMSPAWEEIKAKSVVRDA